MIDLYYNNYELDDSYDYIRCKCGYGYYESASWKLDSECPNCGRKFSHKYRHNYIIEPDSEWFEAF